MLAFDTQAAWTVERQHQCIFSHPCFFCAFLMNWVFLHLKHTQICFQHSLMFLLTPVLPLMELEKRARVSVIFHSRSFLELHLSFASNLCFPPSRSFLELHLLSFAFDLCFPSSHSRSLSGYPFLFFFEYSVLLKL